MTKITKTIAKDAIYAAHQEALNELETTQSRIVETSFKQP